MNRTKNQSTVFHRPSDRTDLVHAPRQRHAPVTADAAKRGAQAGNTTATAGGNDAAQRLASQSKADQAGGRGTGAAGRGAAGAFLHVPRIAGHSTEPLVALSQRTQGE